MIRCSCGNQFAPGPDNHRGPQLFSDARTGEVYLYLQLYNCPACGSTRALVMFCGEPDEDEPALAAE